MNLNDHLQHILRLHFDATWGAPYWLERAPGLDFDPVQDIQSPKDLLRFPPFPRSDLESRPVEDFIPRKFHDQLDDFVTTETGGTTGAPARTAFREDEFHAAFVTPFVRASEIVGFPLGLHWLFIGPSGPHIIGKAARACAKATGSMDPFTVDFDPRWARKLAAGSFAQKRYLSHVAEQAVAILHSQSIGVLFATPPVLRVLGEELSPPIREAIRGIHLGGMAADTAFWQQLSGAWFPNASVLSGYGNSLAGMCPQLAHTPGKPPEYFPHGLRLLFHIENPQQDSWGTVCFHRLDESAFLPNVVERDEAALTSAPESDKGRGFLLPGLIDPRPPHTAPESRSQGLY